MSIQGSINKAIGAIAGVSSAKSLIKQEKEKNMEDIKKYKRAIADAKANYEWESIRRQHFEKEFARVQNEQEKLKSKQIERWNILYGGMDDGNTKTT